VDAYENWRVTVPGFQLISHARWGRGRVWERSTPSR
jgi:hypothetical protein